MALAERPRHNLSLIHRILRVESVFAPESTSRGSSASPNFRSSTVPLAFFGVSGNYASALCLSASKGYTRDIFLSWIFRCLFAPAALVENGRLRNIENIAKSFRELTMAYRGEVKSIVTTVIIDQIILGGLVVEFGRKFFDLLIRTRARYVEKLLRDPVNFENF